jgi:hypothetical protein
MVLRNYIACGRINGPGREREKGGVPRRPRAEKCLATPVADEIASNSGDLVIFSTFVSQPNP